MTVKTKNRISQIRNYASPNCEKRKNKTQAFYYYFKSLCNNNQIIKINFYALETVTLMTHWYQHNNYLTITAPRMKLTKSMI